MRPQRLATMIVSCLLLAACSQDTSRSATTSTEPTAGESESTPGTDPAQVPNDLPGTITVIPNPFDLCSSEDKLAEVDVSWDLSAAQVRNFNIWVEAPSQERKVWVASFTPIDTKRTGRWVRDSTRFTAISTEGRELASVLVTAVPCP